MFESRCDAVACMDKSGESNGIIITRGAGNGAFVSGLVPQSSTVYVFTPNGTDASRTSCYRVLKPDRRFAKHLNQDGDGKLRWFS